MNDTLQALYARKSTRAFEKKPIPPEARQAILEAAFQAPTGGNMMMYTIIDVTDQALKDELAIQCDHQPFIATAPLVLVFLADYRRWLDTYRAAGLSPRRPAQGDIVLALTDAAIAAQNAVVAAESLGVGSCYIGDILEHCGDIRRLLDLPMEVMPAAMLVLGYPTAQQQARRKPTRFDGTYIVQENRYRTLSPEEHRAMYLDRERRDGRENADFESGIAAFCRRKYESDFSLEMSRSVREYLAAFDTLETE